MKFNVSILPTNRYVLEEIVREDIPEEYVTDENGNLTITATILNCQKEIDQLISFLFNGKQVLTEIHRTSYTYVFNLSDSKIYLVDFDYLEKNYSTWLDATQRQNTMDEYGMLIDFIGHIRNGIEKKYLLMFVSTERHCS